MSSTPSEAFASTRAGGTLVLLDTNGRVLAGQHGIASVPHCAVLPFGLQRIVEKIISESRDVFASGNADVKLDFPLALRIFSVAYKSTPAIALYIERAQRRFD